MPFSRALIIGCLDAGKWLALLTAVLFAALLASDYWGGISHKSLGLSITGAGISLALAGMCHLAANRVRAS